jgi:hypothetical protein
VYCDDQSGSRHPILGYALFSAPLISVGLLFTLVVNLNGNSLCRETKKSRHIEEIKILYFYLLRYWLKPWEYTQSSIFFSFPHHMAVNLCRTASKDIGVTSIQDGEY